MRRRLNQINRAFYARSAGEFDATRGAAWAGWERLLVEIGAPLRSVLDVGCGNGRFGLFLAERQRAPFAYVGIDSNRQLLALARQRLAQHPQLQVGLVESDFVLDALVQRPAQLVVLFGVLHHIPGCRERQRFLARLAGCVAVGGHLAFAAWRFYEQERFRRRIVDWDPGWAVEAGDYLLDWRRGARVLRYCHYVDDAEHEALVAATGLRRLADYRADGASGDLNRYSLLQRVV